MKPTNPQECEVKSSNPQKFEVQFSTLKPYGIKSTIYSTADQIKSPKVEKVPSEVYKEDILASATHQLIHGFPPYDEDEDEEEDEEEDDEDDEEVDEEFEDPDYSPDDPDEGTNIYFNFLFFLIKKHFFKLMFSLQPPPFLSQIILYFPKLWDLGFLLLIINI